MKMYIGTKELEAKPMTRGEYNNHRGWATPANENMQDDGYFVRYPDGYVSWSPKPQFEAAYREYGKMNFGHALYFLKQGRRVRRSGWNGKGMYLALQEGSEIPAIAARGGIAKALANEGRETVKICPHIDMRAADGTCVVGWLASQTDMLSEDWEVLGD